MTANITDTKKITKEQAIIAVLEAEKKSRYAIEKCKSEEDKIMQEARQKSQKIIERAEQRMAQIHRICNQLSTNEVNRTEQEAEEHAKQLLSCEIDFKIATVVVEKVAEMLTEEL
ncbi:MAG: hypothetical protein AB4040_19200 [Synechococcus sp.]